MMILQCVDEKLESKESETSIVNDTAPSWPQTIFDLPGSSSGS